MFSVSVASSPQDFEAAALLCAALAQWDIASVQAYGVDPELVRDLYHGQTAESLADRFAQTGAV